MEFRKESFTIQYHFYVCVESGEQFTTTEIDVLNVNQVHNQYRAKYGIPFTDEIKAIREKYDLSAAKMSDILGLGINIYRNYEAGEMPSVATGRLIRLADNPEEFGNLLEMSKNALESHEFTRVKKKIEQAEEEQVSVKSFIYDSIFGHNYPNLFNGYRIPSLEKLGWMISYFAGRNKPFLTAMNKLLFYADFSHFKKYGTGISGIYYKALPKGPVPDNYGILYNFAVNEGFAQVEEVDFGEFVGDRLIADHTDLPEKARPLFSDAESAILKKVSEQFQGLSTKNIIDISHQEPAWQNNVGDFNRISFEYAFELKNVE